MTNNRTSTTIINEKLTSSLAEAIEQKDIVRVDSLIETTGIFSSYEIFSHTLRKIPDDVLRERYLLELKLLCMRSIKSPSLTESEKKYIKSRKLWSDVVSETDQLDESYKA